MPKNIAGRKEVKCQFIWKQFPLWCLIFVLTSLEVGGVDTTRWHFFGCVSWVKRASPKTVACLIWVNTPIHPAKSFFSKRRSSGGILPSLAEDWHQARVHVIPWRHHQSVELGWNIFYRSSVRDLLLSASTCPKYPPKDAKQCGIGWQLLHWCNTSNLFRRKICPPVNKHSRWNSIYPIRNISLGGGFKHFLFHPYLRKWSNLTRAYFSDGWEKTTRSAYCLGGFYRPFRSSDGKHFRHSFRHQVSDDAKQLIRKLLEMKPTDRFTAEQAQHRSVDSRWNRVCYRSCLGRFLKHHFPDGFKWWYSNHFLLCLCGV